MNRGDIPLCIDDVPLAVHTRNVRKRYGRAVALAGLDLTVPDGAFYLLVGPNGSGKLTTIQLLQDMVRADAGVAEVFGSDTRNGAALRAQIGWLPESRDVHYGWMRVSDLIAMHADYYAGWDADYAAPLTRVLDVKLDRKYGQLSKGEARRVQLLLTLAHRPRLLLLDEPTDGLDPGTREKVLEILVDHLVEAPATVIVSTHLIYEMDRLADHIGVLRDGTLVAQMPRPELERRMRIYALEVPADWAGATRHGVTLVRANGGGRELRWMVWGDESDVVVRLAESGAVIRDVVPATLEEAAVALLTQED